MQKARHLFKLRLGFAALFSVLVLPPAGFSAEAAQFKKNDSSLYRDVFERNVYDSGTQFLHLDRLGRAITGKKVRAANANLFDEVPDSTFFTNRHGRKRLSAEELERGYQETTGPDLSGDLVITKGKTEGLHPGFFIKDAKGNGYLFKFDPVDFLELTTSAEVIASRFYHAIGYNVPQYTIAKPDPMKFVPGPNATIVDETGFKKALTQEKLDDMTLFLPQDASGYLRASASKLLQGQSKGPFSFEGRRKEDPNDPFLHKERRELRALQVFSSWINNYDVRESNTLDMLVEENGQMVLKHYLIDFNSAFGAAANGPKPPMFTHEHMIDYKESFKAFLTLGFWEKPWQKRWREAGEEPYFSPAIGYFDNRGFSPEEFKIQLPHFAFKDLTRADGFWAAKIIMTFSNDDIAAMVKAGNLSRSEDVAYLMNTLVERRDLLGQYWFQRANPLDDFQLSGAELTFKDLAVDYGFQPREGTSYHVKVVGKTGGKRKKIETLDVTSPSISLQNWQDTYDRLHVWIWTTRPGSSQKSPYVLVEVDKTGVLGILHQD